MAAHNVSAEHILGSIAAAPGLKCRRRSVYPKAARRGERRASIAPAAAETNWNPSWSEKHASETAIIFPILELASDVVHPHACGKVWGWSAHAYLNAALAQVPWQFPVEIAWKLFGLIKRRCEPMPPPDAPT